MSPIRLASSGLVLNKGCYQSSSGVFFANANIVAVPFVEFTLSSGGGGVSFNNTGGSGNLATSSATISAGSNSTPISPNTPILISGSLVSGGSGFAVVTNGIPPSNVGSFIATTSSGGAVSPTANLTTP
jgi:hypothetical protein